MSKKNSVYLAGGFGSEWQEKVMKACINEFTFFNPKSHNLKDTDEYKVWDLHYVKRCDILFGFIEEDNPYGLGLALEIGYAKGLDKTIILVDQKSQKSEKFERYFKIVRSTADIIFEDLDKGIDYLKLFA